MGPDPTRPDPKEKTWSVSVITRCLSLSDKTPDRHQKHYFGRETKVPSMEDDNSNKDNITVDTTRADRAVWLMKCPPVVSKAWQAAASSSTADSPPVAKVVVSLDPLRADDPSSLQVKFYNPLSLCALYVFFCHVCDVYVCMCVLCFYELYWCLSSSNLDFLAN